MKHVRLVRWRSTWPRWRARHIPISGTRRSRLDLFLVKTVWQGADICERSPEPVFLCWAPTHTQSRTNIRLLARAHTHTRGRVKSVTSIFRHDVERCALPFNEKRSTPVEFGWWRWFFPSSWRLKEEEEESAQKASCADSGYLSSTSIHHHRPDICPRPASWLWRQEFSDQRIRYSVCAADTSLAVGITRAAGAFTCSVGFSQKDFRNVWLACDGIRPNLRLLVFLGCTCLLRYIAW